MPLPLSGAWLRETTWARQPQTQRPHQPDPRHNEPGAGEDPNPTWQATAYQDVAPAPDMPGLEWVTVAAGVILDQTPDDHRDGGPHSALATQSQLSAAHQRDYGADERNTRFAPPFQFTSDRYEQTEVELGEEYAPGVSDTALRRRPGLSADPINNPPLASYLGRRYRPGYYRANWVEHDFAPPPRTHDYRWVRPNVAAVIADAPPPIEPGPYNSPFSSLARAVRNIGRRPMLRRVPETISEPVMTDGTDQAVTEDLTTSWVTG